jgi:formylglycine-generating enzyme required for sulfatase activity
MGDFFLDMKEVTNEEYYQFIKASGRQPPSHWTGGEPDASISQLPVTNVSWDDANEYAKSVGKRLPTEKEWEYGARGSEGRVYPWGNDWDPKCSNSKEDQSDGRGRGPVAVGSYKRCPSPCGAYDMAGNVAEWVADDFALYKGSKAKPVSGNFKVFRGGAYNVAKDELRTFIRWYKPAYYKEPWLGFRCAKDVPKPRTNP